MANKTFTCPHCGKKITSLIEWSIGAIGYRVNLKTGQSGGKPIMGDFAEVDTYACEHCGKDVALVFDKADNITVITVGNKKRRAARQE